MTPVSYYERNQVHIIVKVAWAGDMIHWNKKQAQAHDKVLGSVFGWPLKTNWISFWISFWIDVFRNVLGSLFRSFFAQSVGQQFHQVLDVFLHPFYEILDLAARAI